MAADERIFISYSRKDIDVVVPLVREIERRLDVKCWIDLHGIESDATNFSKVICNAINKTDIFLFMDSENSEKSEWAGKEIRFAKAKNKRVVIILLDGELKEDEFVLEYGGHDNINPRISAQSEKLIRNLHNWLNKRKPIEGSGPLIATANNKPKEAPAKKPEPPRKTGSPVPQATSSIEVKSPLDANVFRIKVRVGDKVCANQEVAIVEALKMENPVTSPCAGIVTSIAVSEGESVSENQVILTIGEESAFYASAPVPSVTQKMIKCSNCGAKNPSEQKFCGKCGVAMGMDLKIDPAPAISKKIPLFVGAGLALLIMILAIRSCVSNDSPEAVVQNQLTYVATPAQTSGAEIKATPTATEPAQKQEVAKTIFVDETTFIDGRDNQQYKSVKIGNAVWMSENLRYAFGNSVCNAAGCEKLGRYYTPDDIASLCPEGWRMPRAKDFASMQKNCKKNPGFCLWDSIENQGSNEVGFSALAAGRYDLHISKFADVGSATFFLAETGGRSKEVYTIKKGEYASSVIRAEQSEGFSVRCVKK